MSLFKERAVTSKKIIALENQIINLKQELTSMKNQPSLGLEELSSLQQENLELKKKLDDSLHSEELRLEIEKLLQSTKSEVSSLKSDLKKVRSENTRLKKKLAKFEEDSSENLIFEDS